MAWRRPCARLLLGALHQASAGQAAQAAAALSTAAQAPGPLVQALRTRCSPSALHWSCSRSLASSSVPDYSREVEDINNQFVAARDEIEYAKEDSETVYFNDAVAEAKVLVDECLASWNALLAKLPDDEKAKLQRSMGLKMEQLKAEFEAVRSLHLED